jgi:hypothetical protein
MLQEKQKISRANSIRLILDISKHSENETHGKSNEEIQQFFESRGYSWERLIELMRTPKQPLPFVENLLRSVSFAVGFGKHDTATIFHHEKPVGTLRGSGQIAMYDYLAKYEQAVICRNRTIKNGQYTELLSCVSHGVASVESYINMQAVCWNNTQSNYIFDMQKTDLGTKLNDWLEKMTGHQLKNSSSWNHFYDYKTINNKKLKHTIEPAHAATFSEIASVLNKFRRGIARTLFELHLAFKQTVPASIIRGMYFPEVEAL